MRARVAHRAVPVLDTLPGFVGVLGLLAVLAFPAGARAQDVSGRWNATWAQAIRIEHDGSLTIQKWGDATLELRQRGDSVTGTWTTRVKATVRWTVSGTVKNGRLSLTSTENDSDDPELAVVQRMRWRGTVTGDGLEGEMTLEFRGGRGARPWRPWRAKRGEGG